MQKQKRYALRKIAGYGLVSCAVGVMLIGGIPTFDSYDNHVFATESTIQSESPYVSQQAKEALQQAINQVNERSAFTSNQVVMEETAQNLDQDRQTGVGYILKALDSLPESIRKFVTGLSFYQKADGYYGLTQSLAGSTRLNTQYYNLQNFDQALGTLYHEISHSIDGKTYTNNGPEYSLSRDEKIVPLLKAIEPNAPIFETWSNLFATYVQTRLNGELVLPENQQKAMRYFDDLLGEALFGSKIYDENDELTVKQSGIDVSIVDEGLQIKIDNSKKFNYGEKIVIDFDLPKDMGSGIFPLGSIQIQGQTVGNVSIRYPDAVKTSRAIALEQFYQKMRSKELPSWTKADLNEYLEIQKLPDNVKGYLVLNFDTDKINALSNRSIILKSPELIKDQSILDNRLPYYRSVDTGSAGTNGVNVNHDLIKNFVNENSSDWKLTLSEYAGALDEIKANSLDNEILGSINYQSQLVKNLHIRPTLRFNIMNNDVTGKVTDRLANLDHADYYDYDSGGGISWRSVDISQNNTYANYSDLLNTKVHHINMPSQMSMVGGVKSEKDRIFKPGDMKQEFFLNSETSGLTVKSELIGTTQHYSMDKVNDYTTVADVLWSDDRSWGTFKPSEVIKGITTHYEWDVIYEKDKITIVNTNEVHMPKYAVMSELGPRLEIGKELNFDTNVVFKDIANWKYGDSYWGKGYATSPISGTYHMYYHDSLNNETKEFTTKPYSYYLQTKESSIVGSGDKLPHDVIVKYVDQTGKEIRLPKTIKDDVAYTDTYKYEPEAIDGYQYLGVTEDSDPLEGIVGYRDKVITVKYQDLSQPITTTEKTKFNWRLHFKDTNGTQLKEDAIVINYYEREVVTNSNGEKSFGNWAFVKQESTNTDGLNLTKAEIKETDNNGVATALFTIVAPGQNSEKYLKSVGDYQLKNYGTPLYYGLHDRIYNVENLQAPEVNKDVDIIYQAKDAVITLRLIGSDNPEKVYHTVEVPAFTNYEHNELDAHVFDSFKSEGELLDNLPNEVALENEGKTIDVRLKKAQMVDFNVYIKNSSGDIIDQFEASGSVGTMYSFDNLIGKSYRWYRGGDYTLPIDEVPDPITLKADGNNDVTIVLKDEIEDTDETHFATYEGARLTSIIRDNVAMYTDSDAFAPFKGQPEFSFMPAIEENYEAYINRGARWYFRGTSDFDEDKKYISYFLGDHAVEELIYNDVSEIPFRFAPLNVSFTENMRTGEITLKDFGYKDARISYKIDGLADYDTYLCKILGYPQNLSDLNNRGIYLNNSYTVYNRPTDDVVNQALNQLKGKSFENEYTMNDAINELLYFTNLNDANLNDTDGKSLLPSNYYIVSIPSEHTIHAKLVNERGEILKDIPLTGRGNDDVTINWGDLSEVDESKYVKPTDLPDSYHMKLHDNQDIVITVKDKLTEEAATKDVTRTIHVTNPDGQTHDEIQKVTFNGKKVTNEATGEVTYKDWTTDDDTLDSYKVPNVPGYTATHTEIAEMQVTPETSNQVVNVTYSANAQQNSIEFYDDDSKQVIFIKDVTGKTGEKVAYDVTSDFENYQDKYETSDALTGTWEVQSENNVVIRIRVTHKTQSEAESKDVHRTIHVHKPDGSVETITQTVIFTRTKTTDLLTNESTYTDWSSENPNYDAYDVPVLTGYKASQETVEEAKSTGKDEVVDVTYEPIEQSIHVKIINERGKTLKDFEVTGKTDENVKINYPDLSELTPKYDLGELPETWTVQKENNQDIVITAKDKLTEEPVIKEITRTIHLHQPDGDKQEVQKVIFTGTKVTNEATGEVTYKNWSTDDDTFKEYQVPEVEGYSVAKDVIPSEKVDKDTVDEVIDIDYVANMQDIAIEIVDENNKVLAMKEVHAKTGENVQYDMTKMFESFKDDYLAKDALSGTYQVQAKDNHVLIHASKRHHSDSETKAITRVIHVTNPDGTQQDVTQTVTFTRSKTTDLTNNQVTYGEWKADNNHFESYDVPKVNGYTSNIGTVELMKVTPETVSSEVSVSYTENVTETTEEKDFIRQIIVKKPDGTKETITQKVHGTRIKTVHEASGETSYSDWVLAQSKFDSYTPEQMEGYHVENVAEQEVAINQSEPIVILIEYKVDTSDSGTQTDTPDVSDGSTQTDNPDSKDDGTQTDNPDTSDTGTQTKVEVPVTYQYEDGTVYKSFTITEDKGYIVDGSDLEMLPDNMDFVDGFVTYEVKGDGTDTITRIVKKNVVDQGSQTDNPDSKDDGTQTDNPDTSDTGTQTKVEIPVTYQYEDGTVYKTFTITEDKGYIVDGSDLETLPDNMDFVDDFVTYEVKGDGTDSIVRIVKKNVVDQGSQTDAPSTNDGSSQTDEPTTSDNGTQTDKPDTTDTGTQTNSLPLAEKKPAKPKNNKPNLLQKHKMQYTSSSKNSLPQAGAKEQASLGILGLSMMVFSGFLSIFNRKNHKN